MIDQTDQQVEEWVKSVVGDVTVSLDVPQISTSGSGVSVYLLEVLPDSVARPTREAPPLKVNLRYLVTPWSSKPKEAHRLLGELIFATLQKTEFEVEADPIPIAIWQSLNLPIRPSFILRVPLLKKSPPKAAPKVRAPVVIKQSPMRPLIGQIVGPDEMAITDALVELPSLNLATRTDATGRFYFAAVPTQPPIQLLQVHAKGRKIDISPAPSRSPNEPLVIRLTETQL
ncbi:MAG: DUF4255 domain-containing protein [Verrucomicrobiales bacterium]|nr:DUF4255 domain-containing protein [Verrucomicrobiales bacterium]